MDLFSPVLSTRLIPSKLRRRQLGGPEWLRSSREVGLGASHMRISSCSSNCRNFLHSSSTRVLTAFAAENLTLLV